MKNLILTILLILTSFLLKAQNDLPRYFIENGDTIGIVLSVEQAQALDNDAELLALFKKMRINCDSLEVAYVKVINKLEQKVAILEIQKKDLIEQGQEKDKLIDNLKIRVIHYEELSILCQKELENKDKQIKILKKEIVKQKLRKILSFGGNATLAIIVAVLIVKN